MSSSGIARSCGSFTPSFLRNLHTVLPSDCTSLHSHHQFKRVQFSTSSSAFIVFRFFCRWPFWQMISHCSFDLYFSNKEQCCIFFSCVCSSSVCLLWRNVCLSLPPIFYWVVCFFDVELLIYFIMSCSYILEINPLSMASFAIIFPHCKCCFSSCL